MDVDLRELTGLSGDDPMNATIESFLTDPSVSNWFKDALVGALRREPVQAVNEAATLFSILNARCEAIMQQAGGLGRT